MKQRITAALETVTEDILPGAYLGGGAIGPWPPLWVARIAKLHRKVSKIEAWPPVADLGGDASPPPA